MPLGQIDLDPLACLALRHFPQVRLLSEAHAKEHAIEVHLPFIQRLWENHTLPQLIPLVVGSIGQSELLSIFRMLHTNRSTLFIISSDLSHFKPYLVANDFDTYSCQKILALENQLNAEQACGYIGINAMLAWAKENSWKIQQLGYCNSGDAQISTPSNMKNKVVGYASFAIYPQASASSSPTLSQEQGQTLCHWAYLAIRQAIHPNARDTNACIPQPEDYPEWSKVPAATFVTLYLDGKLRGCIGSLAAHKALFQDTQHNACNAALRDPRFSPVSPNLLEQLSIEVSVLTPAKHLSYLNQAHALWQLRPYIDGVILSYQQNGRVFKSTFLPQVWESIPDPIAFMAHLKQKAGMPTDFWSNEIQLSTYQVEKFHYVRPTP
ncbi:MAG: AmmeMemoRadiSam system protein A [Gammaproteobacteria bacterium]|nr:AmmeMemoRadiSam system protein A [Gammaproteobacteria bacterium]